MVSRPLAAVLLAAAVSACGSTVVTSTTLSAPGAGGVPDGLGTGPTAGSSGAAGPTGGAAPVGREVAGAVQAPGGVAVGGPAAAPGAAPVLPAGGQPATDAADAPGVTATTIKVGVYYGVNGRAAAAAFGATGAGAGGGDGRKIWTVALQLVNESGGVLGRRLVPVFHEVDSTSTETSASREQAMCAAWTQDSKVFWASAGPLRTLTPCLAKAGVSQSASTPTDAGTAFYRQYSSFIEAGTLQMDRVAASLPALLQRQGWFGAWDTTRGAAGGTAPVKVGIVSFDDPYTKHAVNDVLVPALRRVVPTAPVVVQVQTPQSTSDNGSAIAAMQNATLRFRREGVTHVLPFETQGAGIGVFVAQGADQQRYYPRYGVTSGNAVQLYADQALWPASQLRGTLGIGWAPLLDLTNADNPDDGPFSNAARRSCLDRMRKEGVDVTSAIIKRQALEYCTNLRFLKAALESGGAVTRDAFRLGAERLGTSFESALTFATRYGPDRHDGVSRVRALAYLPECRCMRYKGGLLDIP